MYLVGVRCPVTDSPVFQVCGVHFPDLNLSLSISYNRSVGRLCSLVNVEQLWCWGGDSSLPTTRGSPGCHELMPRRGHRSRSGPDPARDFRRMLELSPKFSILKSICRRKSRATRILILVPKS